MLSLVGFNCHSLVLLLVKAKLDIEDNLRVSMQVLLAKISCKIDKIIKFLQIHFSLNQRAMPVLCLDLYFMLYF